MAVGRGHGNGHAGLPDAEPSRPVLDGHGVHRPPGPDLLPDLAQLRLGHLRVGLVLQVGHLASAGRFAHDAQEPRHGPRGAGAHLARQGIQGERAIRHPVQVPFARRRRAGRPAAHRGNQPHLVPVRQTMVRRAVFAIHRQHEGGRQRLQAGVGLAHALNELAQGAPVRRLQDQLRRPHDLPHRCEQAERDLHGASPQRRMLSNPVLNGGSKGSRCKAAWAARSEAYVVCTPQVGPFQQPTAPLVISGPGMGYWRSTSPCLRKPRASR